MKPDAFEQELARRSPRQIPAHWRAEILRAARSAAAAPAKPRLRLLDWLSTFREQLSPFLSPSRRAWGALAAVWVLIAALNLATREASPTHLAQPGTRPALNWQEARRQQQQILAELAGLNEQPVADRSRSGESRPRSAAPVRHASV